MRSLHKDEIYGEYQRFARDRKKFSNCYFSVGELAQMIEDKHVRGYLPNGSLVLCVQENGFEKLYFMGDSMEWTAEFARIKGTQRIAAEVVVKGSLGSYDLRRLVPCGEVIQYTRYRRNGLAGEALSDHDAVYGTREDIRYIRTMLDKEFSPIGDYIPGDMELKKFIEKNAVLCLKDNDKVMGYVIFEDKGKTSYIRNICVDSRYRRKGVGKKLMDAYLYRHREFKSFTLWCRTGNEPAVKLYTGGGILKMASIILSFFADVPVYVKHSLCFPRNRPQSYDLRRKQGGRSGYAV